MMGFIASRLLNAAATLVAAVIATFVMIRIAPGDPVLVLLGDLASPDQIAAARIEYGLDRPLYEQLFIYVGKVFTLDYGKSIIQGRPAIDIVAQRMLATLTLGAITFALVIAVAVPLGLLAALYRGRLFDRAVSNSSLVVLGIPDFWLGLVFILVFARWLQILPSSGWSSPSSIVLPAVTLALPLIAVNMRLMRNEGIGVLNSNMVKILRAKGIPTRRIVSHHVLRNALLPGADRRWCPVRASARRCCHRRDRLRMAGAGKGVDIRYRLPRLRRRSGLHLRHDISGRGGEPCGRYRLPID